MSRDRTNTPARPVQHFIPHPVRSDEHGRVHLQSRRIEQESASSGEEFPVGTAVACEVQTARGIDRFRGTVAGCFYSRVYRSTVVSVRDESGQVRKLDAAHVRLAPGGAS